MRCVPNNLRSMERRKEETLGNVVLRYLRLAGLETPLAEHRLVEAWPEVAGEALAAALLIKGRLERQGKVSAIKEDLLKKVS